MPPNFQRVPPLARNQMKSTARHPVGSKFKLPSSSALARSTVHARWRMEARENHVFRVPELPETDPTICFQCSGYRPLKGKRGCSRGPSIFPIKIVVRGKAQGKWTKTGVWCRCGQLCSLASICTYQEQVNDQAMAGPGPGPWLSMAWLWPGMACGGMGSMDGPVAVPSVPWLTRSH